MGSPVQQVTEVTRGHSSGASRVRLHPKCTQWGEGCCLRTTAQFLIPLKYHVSQCPHSASLCHVQQRPHCPPRGDAQKPVAGICHSASRTLFFSGRGEAFSPACAPPPPLCPLLGPIRPTKPESSRDRVGDICSDVKIPCENTI